MSNDGNVKIGYEVDDKQLEAAMQKAVQSFDKMSGAAQKSAGQMNSGFFSPVSIGFAAVAAAAYKSVDAFNEQEKVMNRIGAQLKATGNASGMTSKQISAMADEFSKLTNFDDDEILGGQSTLLKFKNIGQEVFPRATKAMLDFASVTGQDASTAAQTLGKALNNPLEASSALKRAGIDLTRSQEQQIEAFIKVGDVASAQNVILKELEGTMGGAAEAMVSPVDQMKNGFGDLFKVIGELLMPTVRDFANNVFIPFLTWIKDNKELFGYLAAGATALALALTGPVGIAGAIAVCGTTLYAFRDKFKLILLQLGDLLLTFYETVVGTIAKISGFISKDLEKTINIGTEKIKEFRGKLKAEMDQIRKDEKDAADKKEKEEQARANKGSKDQQKKAGKALKADTPDAKEQDEKLKSWKKTYGELSREDIQYLRNKEKLQQKHAKDELKEEQTILKKAKTYKKNMTDQELDYAIKAEKKNAQEKKEISEFQFNFENNIGNARMEYTQNLLGNLSTLQQSKSKEAFEVGKAASIANATINMWQSATNSYNAMSAIPIVGPALGFAAAAAAVAAGMVQIDNISSQQFAYEKGGIAGDSYIGASAGPDNMTASLRRGEMILDGYQQRNLFDAIKFNRLGSEEKQTPAVIYTSNFTINADSTTDAKKLAKEVKKVIEKDKKRTLMKQKFIRS